MKKNFNMIFAAAAAFAMVLSCSKEENPSQGTQGAGSADSLTPLTISATLPEDMTKVSFTPSYDGGKPQSLSLAWEAEDKLRVYNHDDRTQYADFDVVPGSVGQKTGYFTGDIFAATSYDVEVINGAEGFLVVFLSAIFETINSTSLAFSSFKILFASSSDAISIFLPLYFVNSAVNGILSFIQSAFMLQYSVGTNASINSSLSTIIFKATLWTRPAESL